MNYNKLLRIPPELGECENLERLEMTANGNLAELPFEVRHHIKCVLMHEYLYVTHLFVCIIPFSAEQSQKTEALGRGRESVCRYSGLRASHGKPEVFGYQQQQTQRPAGGHRQVCVCSTYVHNHLFIMCLTL